MYRHKLRDTMRHRHMHRTTETNREPQRNIVSYIDKHR